MNTPKTNVMEIGNLSIDGLILRRIRVWSYEEFMLEKSRIIEERRVAYSEFSRLVEKTTSKQRYLGEVLLPQYLPPIAEVCPAKLYTSHKSFLDRLMCLLDQFMRVVDRIICMFDHFSYN